MQLNKLKDIMSFYKIMAKLRPQLIHLEEMIVLVLVIRNI
jgi:hypothetical protein